MKVLINFPTQYLQVAPCDINKLTTRYGSHLYLGDTQVIVKGTTLYFAVSFWCEVQELHDARVNLKSLLPKIKPFKHYCNGAYVLARIESGKTATDIKFNSLLTK